MAKLQAKQQTFDPDRGPILSARFGLALVLMALGIAWIVFYYVGVRAPEPSAEVLDPQMTGPGFMKDLAGYNYLVGFAIFFVGLALTAHPSTPLGRGRGVVVGMLGCFLVGLVWICVFYAISDDVSGVPVYNDLGNKSLVVGIVFMAVGFTFATRWE